MIPAKTQNEEVIPIDIARKIRSFKASLLVTGILMILSLTLNAVQPDFAVALSFSTVAAVIILTTFAVFCYLFNQEILVMFGSYQFGVTVAVVAMLLVWNHLPVGTWFAMLLGIATLGILFSRIESRR